ncbi:MAG: ABC transporter permease [Planctomycetes bacterium]|nr:ABC transporter permease [Planctomycetota bacterium]
MSKIAIIAWREFTQTVLRKIFLLAIIGIPVLIVGAIVLMVVVMAGHEEPPLEGTIAVVDPTGEVIEAARREFDPTRIEADRQQERDQIQQATQDILSGGATSGAIPGINPRAGTFEMGISHGRVDVRIEAVTDASDATVDDLRQRVHGDDLLAVAIIPADVLETPDRTSPRGARPKFGLLVAERLDADHADFIERRIGKAVVRVRAERAGLDPDTAMALLEPPSSNTTRMLANGEEVAESTKLRKIRSLIIPMAFMMLLWVAVFTSSQHLMMSTIEEKSNRVMEVLLSAVSPFQLMAGKILGHGFVGLLIMSIYSSLAVIGLALAARMDLITVSDLVFLVVYFFMAYFMIASIMAAVGGAVTDIREANTLIMPVMFVVMIPLMLWMPISEAPNGGLATSFSYIPPAIPFVMILRIAADEPVPVWQIPATIAWGYACVLAMVWMSAKIFRVGVLMYGKPPSPLQLIKWLRYA